jgi:hypothetical protein
VARHQTIGDEDLTELASQNGSIPAVDSLLEQPWWLDIVAPGAWGAAEILRDARWSRACRTRAAGGSA